MRTLLKAVIDKGFGVLGNSTLHSGIVTICLRSHTLRVHVPGCEREATRSIGINSVLVLSVMYTLG